MAAGSIVLDLLMQTGSFETDTNRAVSTLKSLQKQAEATAAAFKGSFFGNLLASEFQQAVSAIGDLPGKVLEAVDAFNHLRDATGASIENISAIDRIARERGLGFDVVEQSIIKLNKALSDTNPDSTIAKALTAIGLSANDLRKVDPAEALRQVAVALSGYADDGNKARLVQDLFKRSIQEVAPLLTELARSGGLVATTTSDQAAQVEEYRKSTSRLKADIEDLSRSFLISLIPVLVESTAKLKEFFGVGPETAGTARTEVAVLEAQLKKLQNIGPGFSVAGFFGTEQSRNAEIDKVAAQLAAARTRLQAAVAGTSKAGAGRGFVNPELPSVGVIDTTPKGPKDDPTKRELDNQLKAIQAGIDAEKDLFATRNQFIQLYNGQNLLGLDNYYAALQAAQDEETKGEIDGYNQQIAALQAFQAKSTTTRVQYAEAAGKIADANVKIAKTTQDADRQTLLLGEQKRFAADALAKQYEAVNVQVLELKENFSAAAAIKFDQQFDSLTKIFTANGNQAGLQAIAVLRSAAIAAADYQKASLATQRTLEDLSNAEVRLGILQQTGALTSLGLLIRQREEREKQIPILEAEVAAQEAIAKAKGDETLARNAEQARINLEKLKASVDPLAASLNAAFGADLEQSLNDFVTGTKSAADAFHSFTNAILTDILKLGTKSIAESIFGGSGGAGGLISDFLSGRSTGGGSGGGFQGIGDNSSPPASSGSGAGVGLIAGVAKLFSGFFADGGVIPPGQVGVVGERGPELAYGGSTGKTISPIGGTTQNIVLNVTATPGMSRDTAMQQGAAYGAGIQKALARNG
jgi:hypothetical protein